MSNLKKFIYLTIKEIIPTRLKVRESIKILNNYKIINYQWKNKMKILEKENISIIYLNSNSSMYILWKQ